MNRREFLRKGGLSGGFFLAGAPFLLSRPGPARDLVSVERVYVSMGTTVRFLVYHEDEPEAVAAIHEAQSIVQAIHRLMSVQEPASELSRWNRSARGLSEPFDALTAGAIDEAFAYVSATGGRFDPTVGTLVAAFEKGGLATWHSERIASWDSAERRMKKSDPDVRLDLGGSAKGWAVDRAMEVLSTRGVEIALINAGGDLRVTGRPPGDSAWRIGIRNPVSPEEPFCELRLSDCAIATSGGYEREGSTLVDPRDGSRVTFRGSATVVASTCGAADCLSTALSVEPSSCKTMRGDAFTLVAQADGDGLSVDVDTRLPAHWLVQTRSARVPIRYR